MGKKQRVIKSSFKESSNLNNKTLLSSASRDFIYDELDDFHDERDNRGLGGVQIKGVDDTSDEEEVLGLGNLASDDDENKDKGSQLDSSDDELLDGDDDIVDQEEEGSGDERAWGKQKNLFYGTDITDERIHRETTLDAKKKGKRGNEESLQLEEEGVKRLQERMSQQLKGLSFTDLIPEITQFEVHNDTSTQDQVKIDISGMSSKKKIKLLKQESPEFFPVVQDLKEKVSDLQSTLIPLLKGVKDELIETCPMVDYLRAKYCLTLNYISNVSAYMVVKASGASVAQHPVINRLYQYRVLFDQLQPCQNIYENEINETLHNLKSGKLKARKLKKKKNKLLNLLTSEKKKPLIEFCLSDDDNEELHADSNLGPSINREIVKDSDSDAEEENSMEVDGATLDNADERRPIGHVIFKNKGLMPKRAKESRNPRIKYKNKYKNKLKKRKGQVRNVRTEVRRYDGEMSGIKKSVVKSRKLK